MFIARKQKPKVNTKFKLIGITERTERWTDATIRQIGEMVTKGNDRQGLGKVKQIPQTELLPENSALSALFLRMEPDYDEAWKALEDIHSISPTPLVKIKELFEQGLEITEVYHGEYRPLAIGPKALLACRTEERALKATDRLVLHRSNKNSLEFKDRISPDSRRYQFASREIGACIRRFSYLTRMDITDDSDFIVTKTGEALEKTMKAFYTKAESSRYLRNMRRAHWEDIIERGGSRVNICARTDLAAPGTMLLAFRSGEPAFLAGAYGYNVRGFKHEREEKLFTLWFNSTMGLIQLLAKATITRGSWIKLEQFTTEQVLMPDPEIITEKQWDRIEKLWEDISKESVPSLLMQLEKGSTIRNKMDIELLKTIGIKHSDAQANAAKLQRGALSAIQMLLRTMEKS
jgi:hypothetical protein